MEDELMMELTEEEKLHAEIRETSALYSVIEMLENAGYTVLFQEEEEATPAYDFERKFLDVMSDLETALDNMSNTAPPSLRKDGRQAIVEILEKHHPDGA